MIYNPGDILKTPIAGTHVIIIRSFVDNEGIGFYKLSPLHDLGSAYMYNIKWVEDKLTLVQRIDRQSSTQSLSD